MNRPKCRVSTLISVRTVKPALLKGPADLVIIENEDGYFQATITGKPEPTIQWQAFFSTADEKNNSVLVRQ